MDTATPRTDERLLHEIYGGDKGNVVAAVFARQLERELIASAERVARLEAALQVCVSAMISDPPHGPQKTIGGDETIYHLNGLQVYAALNAARQALGGAK